MSYLSLFFKHNFQESKFLNGLKHEIKSRSFCFSSGNSWTRFLKNRLQQNSFSLKKNKQQDYRYFQKLSNDFKQRLPKPQNVGTSCPFTLLLIKHIACIYPVIKGAWCHPDMQFTTQVLPIMTVGRSCYLLTFRRTLRPKSKICSETQKSRENSRKFE